MNENHLKLIIVNSFLGAICRDIRALAYDYTDDTIIIYGYLDRKPDNEDYEVIDVAVTEIMASCPNFLYQRIELIKSNLSIGQLAAHRGWIFVRYE